MTFSGLRVLELMTFSGLRVLEMTLCTVISAKVVQISDGRNEDTAVRFSKVEIVSEASQGEASKLVTPCLRTICIVDSRLRKQSAKHHRKQEGSIN